MELGDIRPLSTNTGVEVKRLDVGVEAYTICTGDETVTLLGDEMRELVDAVEEHV